MRRICAKTTYMEYSPTAACAPYFRYHNTATVVRLCLQNAILQGSNISIGGSTDRFDANRYDNDGESDWGEWNGREETLEE